MRGYDALCPCVRRRDACRRVNAMPAQLLALNEGPNIVLDKPILLLGRHQECDIQIGSRKVSRRHCCLAQVDGYFVVRDLGSTNGIRINGVKVMEGNLKNGDELTIGNQRYQLQWASKAAEDASLALPPSPSMQPDHNLDSFENPVALPEPAVAAKVPIAGIPTPPIGYDDSHQPAGKQ